MKIFFLILVTFLISQNALAEGQSESIGTHNNGCMLYSAELSKNSQDYKLPRVERGHNYGHPEMVELLEDYSYRVKQMTGKELLIADISKKNGGPVFMLHSSHQTGLDADIWFTLYDAKQNLSSEDIKTLQPLNMADEKGKSVSSFWGSNQEDILKLFAQNDKVDRIFVNYNIKNYYCSKFKNEDWQKKIRPWWGHNEHFHIRLKCPKNSEECISKGQEIKNDGCGSELAWWFSDEAKQPKSKKEAEAKLTEEQILERLPNRCKEILKDEILEVN
ncbi:MAG: penicillin-insensitive murein endopeptidase [Rickettsiales bacterium]|nr:penicillin-insensitive murein endopeptidase [Rickettsiales bacterium]